MRLAVQLVVNLAHQPLERREPERGGVGRGAALRLADLAEPVGPPHPAALDKRRRLLGLGRGALPGVFGEFALERGFEPSRSLR